ncbi:TolC family protein, partial [bacterium]|nr:TolC family protein [bacterium]
FMAKEAFYNVLLQRELMKVNRAAIQRDSTLLMASNAKVVAELATRRDVLSAEIQLASDRVKLIKSQTDFENSLEALKEVLGLPIEMPVEIAQVELDFEPKPLDANRLTERAMLNSPSIQKQQLAIKSSRVQHTLAKNDRLPQLDLLASYNGSFESDTDENVDLNSAGWEFSLSFSYPLFNREAASAAEIASIDISQQEENLNSLQRQLRIRIRSIVRTIYGLGEEIRTLERSIESAEQKVAFATIMFDLGRASNLDITDAQEALLNNQTEYLRNLVDYHTQLAFLESLIGEPLTR